METPRAHLSAILLGGLLSFSGLFFSGSALAQPPENTGTVQQPLVGGTLVDQPTQEQFGLLTLTNPAGTCSASMLNDFWAITAAHCVFQSLTATSAQLAPSQITLTSNWPGYAKTFPAIQVIAFSTFPWSTNDVALLQLGYHSFARSDQPARPLNSARPMANLTLMAFGRGINQFASGSGATAVPSSGDGQFRSAQFSISSVNPNSSIPPQTFAVPGNRGAAVAGGDSGGPAYYQDYDNPLSPQRRLQWQLMGVFSNCVTNCVSGKVCGATAPNPWQWVNSVQSCNYASIFPIRDQILNAIQQDPPFDNPPGSFDTTVPPAVLAHKRALYAVNIDEPLIAPPNAAIDVQLKFQICHDSTRVAALAGCPLSPAQQIWGYDSATHRVLHVPSGKCLNISGARTDPGAPIILYPCSGAPNEKWTIISPPATSNWTIKSDLTNQCLTAIPGRPAGGDRTRFTLAQPGTLTQMPCDGSSAQVFADADADWARRNGPH